MDPRTPQRDALFDSETQQAAERHGSESHFRWLALSDDPEAVALRAALERCFRLAGRRGGLLRKGLMHERWGQHAGALAHLLALGLLARQGWSVEVEPDLGGQAPDILVTRGAARLLVEVRAISGAGNFPWEERRSSRRPGHEPERREALTDSVAAIIARKADVYRTLVARLKLPYVICLYEDKDDLITSLVLDIAFGRSAAGARSDAADGRDADGGAFAHDAAQFGAVSALIVFGRQDTESGELLLRGDLIVNPHADQPLPPEASLPLLRRCELDPVAAGAAGPAGAQRRVRWSGAPSTFTLDDEA
jgi:hypothetical protein